MAIADRTYQMAVGYARDLVQGWYTGRPGAATDVEGRMAQPTGGKHRLPVPEQQPRGGDASDARVTPA